MSSHWLCYQDMSLYTNRRNCFVAPFCIGITSTAVSNMQNYLKSIQFFQDNIVTWISFFILSFLLEVLTIGLLSFSILREAKRAWLSKGSSRHRRCLERSPLGYRYCCMGMASGDQECHSDRRSSLSLACIQHRKWLVGMGSYSWIFCLYCVFSFDHHTLYSGVFVYALATASSY